MGAEDTKSPSTDDATKCPPDDDTIDDVTIESYNELPSLGKDRDAVIGDLKRKLAECKAESAANLDGWQRAKADYANLKRREEDARVEFGKYAAEGLISELIPILENFALARKNKEVWEKVDESWRTGIEHIHNQLVQILSAGGLSEIVPLGEAFDPTEHSAIATIPTSNKLQEGRIADVVQSGYRLNGKLIKSPQVRIYEYTEGESSE